MLQEEGQLKRRKIKEDDWLGARHKEWTNEMEAREGKILHGKGRKEGGEETGGVQGEGRAGRGGAGGEESRAGEEMRDSEGWRARWRPGGRGWGRSREQNWREEQGSERQRANSPSNSNSKSVIGLFGEVPAKQEGGS